MSIIKFRAVSLLSLLIFLPQTFVQSQAINDTAVLPAQSAFDQYLPLIASPPLGNNVLPNASFEGGWYHPNGIPELQIPDGWTFSWEEGPNPLAPESWNNWVRPEVRVLPSEFLPEAEHDLFIWDGNQTVKVFKGYGSISYSLQTTLPLDPGTYLLEVNVYPDLVVDYVGGQKVFAPDPLSGEVKLDANGASTGWLLPTFGDKNEHQLIFTVTNASDVTIKASFRGRWAIRNNGWFMDDWGLYSLSN